MSKSLMLTISCLAPGRVPKGRNADMKTLLGLEGETTHQLSPRSGVKRGKTGNMRSYKERVLNEVAGR